MKSTAFPELKTRKLLGITHHALERIKIRWTTLWVGRSTFEIRRYLSDRIDGDGTHNIYGVSVVVKDSCIITIY